MTPYQARTHAELQEHKAACKLGPDDCCVCATMRDEGQTCGATCYHWSRCSWLIACAPNRLTCDWMPSRYKPMEAL